MATGPPSAGGSLAPTAGNFGRIPPTGRRVDYHACAVMQIRDGKIAYVRTYLDTGVIPRQLGVLPEDD